MDKRTKYFVVTILIFTILYVGIWFGFNYFFTSMSLSTSGLAVVLAMVLAPRVSEVDTQSGTKLQIKWIFSKKVIIV